MTIRRIRFKSVVSAASRGLSAGGASFLNSSANTEAHAKLPKTRSPLRLLTPPRSPRSGKQDILLTFLTRPLFKELDNPITPRHQGLHFNSGEMAPCGLRHRRAR